MAFDSIEKQRLAYRPQAVRVLFVGESPPAGGTFFYRGDSYLARYTYEAFRGAPADSADMSRFLDVFRDRGCYLVDLCRDPVNAMSRRERSAARRSGVPGLASAMRDLRPAANVVVMKGILGSVRRAASEAGLGAVPLHALPFPARGHQRRFVAELSALLPEIRDAGGQTGDC